MKTWSLSPGGVLAVSDDTGRFPATAEQIYASIVERPPEWEDMPAGKHGAATEVDFSAYSVDAVLMLHISGDARPAIRLEARTELNQSFQLSREAIRHGHVIHEGTWHPVSAADTHSITILLRTLGLDPDAPDLTTVRQCLALRRAAANGGPVVDRLRDDVLLNLSSIEHGAGPEGIDATLYPYQVRGWQWLRFIISEQAGGLLADEMGLGKTLQVISALRDHGSIPSTAGSLVLAPGSLLENWAREIAKSRPGLHAVKHHGPDRTGSPAELRPPDVVITSYETAIRDLPLLRMIQWHVVVLDEAQNIRNPDTRRAKAVKHLRREVSIAVTGTPVENRLCKEEGIAELDPEAKRTRALDPRRADTIVHTEQGEVRCICPETGTERPMAFQGFEAERSTLKYRCPAAAAGAYGRIVRIPLARHARRIFTPTPHASPSWQRGYRRRAALEWIYRRVDHDFGLERHFVRGQARIGLSVAVMMAAALGHVRAGEPRRMRSLVQPFADTG